MTVRRATESDVPALRSLQRRLPEPSPSLLSVPLVADAVVSTDARNRPVGYVLAVAGETGTHVAELVVTPARRREGRGRALLERVVAETPGPHTVAVAPENEAARALYASVGFEPHERRPAFFADGPALVLRRRGDGGDAP